MPNAPAKPVSDTTGEDKETLVSIVKDMTESTSNRDWRKYSVRELLTGLHQSWRQMQPAG